MNKKNLLIYTTEKHLLYIGENLISRFVRTQLPEPYGYPAGHMRSQDLFLIFIPYIEKLGMEQHAAVKQIYGNKFPKYGAAVFLGVYQSSEDDYIMKILHEEAIGERILLNTVFHGHHVKLEISADGHEKYCVRVDRQHMMFSAETNSAMIVFNTEGVRYYHEAVMAGDMTITDVLSGKPYEAYWDLMRMQQEHRLLSEIMTDEICSVCNDGFDTIEMAKGSIYCFQSMKMCMDSQEVFFLQAFSESEMVDEMRCMTQKYTEMHRVGGMPEMQTGYTFGLWGNDEKINRIRYLLQKGAVTNTTILLTGESGTGKTFLAHEIHKGSHRSDKPFIHVNCAAIPYNLLESELFGYEEGAFTGAKKGGKVGYFQMAEHGTLFLDEITELPISLQGKLLEILQNRTYFAVGGERKKQADVRLIAATNKNLQELVERRLFREDLFYRINAFPVEVPPLRERLGSLHAIVTDILPEICMRLEVPQLIISPAALDKMKEYHWPGNIRELENVLEKACILSDGKVILAADVELQMKSDGNTVGRKSLKAQRDDFERDVIENTLKLCGGSRLQTARYLQIGKTSLFEKMKKYGIENYESEDSDI